MNANLLSLAQNALGGDFSKLAGQFLGETPASTQGAVNALLPAILGRVAQQGATPDGASNLMSLISGANLDTSALANVGSLFSGAGAGANDLLKAGTSRLVPALFGDKSGALVNALSSASGIRTSSATNLIAIAVPLVLTMLKKLIGDRGLNANSLSSLLASQGPNLQGALDSRITSALGFGSVGAFLGGLGGAGDAALDSARRAGAAVGGAADAAVGTARRAGAAVASGAAAAGSAAMAAGSAAVADARWTGARLLPWLIAAAVLFLLWLFLWPRAQAPAPTQPVASQAPVSMAAAPAFSGFPAKVYFDTGSASVGADGSKVIEAAASAIKSDNAKVVVTGYTDRTGDTAKNEELAKNRAMAVRDALKAAGISEANIEMKPPLFVEGGATSASAEARRVEINKM
ncbi:MAG TPA: OmpA family protein [Casimicrobiaceae bacterium]|nr:OmpA family protein [Casimicrobiaceae bacterium]